MSRYPFIAYATRYLETRKGIYSPATWETARRRYSRQNKDFIKLFQEGKLSTLSPKVMTAEDVRIYLTYRRQFNYTHKEYSHDHAALKSLFAFLQNNAYETCIIKNPILKPRGRSARLPPMTDEVYEAILKRSQCVDVGDWERIRAYTLVLLALRSGARTKELQLAQLKDLDLDTWMMDLVHVKGELTYGQPRSVPIHPEIRNSILAYIELRKNQLQKKNRASIALFPSFTSPDGFLSTNSLRRIKQLVENECGVKFDFRATRRTYGQQLIDKGVNIEAVSVSMGHATTRTTELAYCRKRSEIANKEIQERW